MPEAGASETIRAMVVMQGMSGLPRDQFVNTFHFHCPTHDETTHSAIRDLLEDFYGLSHGDGTVGQFISPAVDRTKCLLKTYDLGDAKPRPVRSSVFAIPSNAAPNGLPDEVAVTLSYYADRNIKRHRGRLFIGPLTTDASSDNQTDRAPSITLRNVLAANALNLILPDGPTGATWGLWSTMDNVLRYPVTGGWVDNAFDTVRKRGVRPTTRTSFSV